MGSAIFSIALANLCIGAQEKCEKYWPDMDEPFKKYEHMRTTILNETEKSSDLIERILEVTNINKGEPKK